MTRMIAATFFMTKPTLDGERSTLRPFQTQDIAAMAGILRDPEVLHLTGGAHSMAETGSGGTWGHAAGRSEVRRRHVDAHVMSILRSDWLLLSAG